MDVRVRLWRSWAPKNWCFWTVVLEKTLESPLDCKKFQPVHSEGDQPWDYFGRNDAKAETPVLWPPHSMSWLIGKYSDAGRDWGQEEKGKTGWDGWIASLTRWTWVWVNSGGWCWTGRPGVLRFMGSGRVGHNWAIHLIWAYAPGRHDNLLSLHSATCIFHYLAYDTEVILQIYSSNLKLIFFAFQLVYHHTCSAPPKPTFFNRFETTVEVVFWCKPLLFLNTFFFLISSYSFKKWFI